MKRIALCTCGKPGSLTIANKGGYSMVPVMDDDVCKLCRHYVYYKWVPDEWKPENGLGYIGGCTYKSYDEQRDSIGGCQEGIIR